MFINSVTQRRVNIYAAFTDAEDNRYGNLLDPMVREQLGVIEIADPQPPTDYSEDTYYRTEQDNAPYVVYTRKSDEQINEAKRAKALAGIAQLEEVQLRASLRMQRERELETAEQYALQTLGLTPQQLYDVASQPGAPTAFITYKRMKDLDLQIKALRESL